MNTVNVAVTVVATEVYRRGCSITCQGRATLAEGENRLVVEGLPEGLDDGSVSVRMPPVVSLGQVSVKREKIDFIYEDIDSPTELDTRIDELDRRIANKERELKAWEDLATRIAGNHALEYLDRFPGKLDELSSELSRLRVERRAAGKQRDKQREELVRPRLEIDVTTTEAGDMPLELVCRSNEAGWIPSYDVLVDDLAVPLRLRMKGSVWQRTGIDWRDVALRLSTGTASVLGDLPRFAPRYLRKAEPRPTSAPRYMQAKMGAMRSSNDLAMDMALPAAASPEDTITGLSFGDVVEAAAPEAEVLERATATTYELVGAQTLLSDADEQLFTVSTTQLAATYHLYTYPRRDEATYLVAHLDTEPAPEVLEQPLSVYIEGSYAGTIRMGRATDEHGYELPLGRDKRVRVHRKEDVSRSSKLFGGKVTIEHACTIGVESHTRAPMDIVVIEQVPVSRDKEIEVALREGSGATFDKERGELRWERTISPEERITLAATYVVSHAKGMLIDETRR